MKLCREADTSPAHPGQRRHEPRLRLLGVEVETLEHRVDTGVIDVAAEVGEALLVVPEPLEKGIRDALAHLAELDRLLGDALLEHHDLTPGGGAGLPDGCRALEGPMLVEQGVPQSGLRATLPVVGGRSPVMTLKIDVLPVPLRPDDPPSFAFGDGEGEMFLPRSSVEPRRRCRRWRRKVESRREGGGAEEAAPVAAPVAAKKSLRERERPGKAKRHRSALTGRPAVAGRRPRRAARLVGARRGRAGRPPRIEAFANARQ